MKELQREAKCATLNGQRFVRYSAGNVDAALLVHETSVDVLRFVEAAIACERANVATWHVVYSSGGAMTCRMQVPGGWIVKHSSADGMAQCFVPDAKHSWKTKVERTV